MEFLTEWNFYGLCVFMLLCIGALVWQRMYYTRLAMEHLMWMREQGGEQAEHDKAERRRMVHEADLKDASLRGKAKIEELRADRNGGNTDEYRRRLNAGIASQHSASMEPFCGEGKRP